MGMTFSFGVILPALKDRYQIDDILAGLVESLFIAISHIVPLIYVMLKIFGHRWSSFIGSLMATVAFGFFVFGVKKIFH